MFLTVQPMTPLNLIPSLTLEHHTVESPPELMEPLLNDTNWTLLDQEEHRTTIKPSSTYTSLLTLQLHQKTS